MLIFNLKPSLKAPLFASSFSCFIFGEGNCWWAASACSCFLQRALQRAHFWAPLGMRPPLKSYRILTPPKQDFRKNLPDLPTSCPHYSIFLACPSAIAVYWSFTFKWEAKAFWYLVLQFSWTSLWLKTLKEGTSSYLACVCPTPETIPGGHKVLKEHLRSKLNSLLVTVAFLGFL